ncbi:MAG: S41 family peptidase [Acidobacteriota bacterium]
MKRCLFAALCALLLATAARAQNPAQAPAQTVAVSPSTTIENPAGIRQQTFDIVWRTVKDKHFDPNFGGVNWDKVREQYAPRVADVKNDGELYRLLQQMLGELHQSHFNIIPPEAIIPDDVKEPTTGGIGVDVRMINGAAVITRVEQDSTAAQAGLRTGFVIQKISGQKIIGQAGEKTVDEFIALYAKGNLTEAMRNLRTTRRVMQEINGDPASTVKLVYLDAKDQQHTATIARAKLKGELSQRLGQFPPQYTEFESKRLPQAGGSYIAYIRFNIFTTPVTDKIRAAIREMHDADGMIFDLRGNPGGVAGIAVGIAGQLFDKGATLGTMKMRSSEVKFAIFPQTNPFTGPVAILLDGLSGSTSEVFSSGMQETGRAVIIGERSAGACLPSYFQKLPTGALFQFAIADFRTPKGILIEGRGVIPDVELKWNRASLLAGSDAQIDAAIAQVSRLRQRERAVK